MKLVYHADADKDGVKTIQSGIYFRFGEAKQMGQKVCHCHGGKASCTEPEVKHAQEQQQNAICIVLRKKYLGIAVDDAVQV